ncbi:HREF motif-containing protein [Cryptosporidium canis]|uniref:HREF motif-containing protein n=1 Tax=Cryptosporidium canis TaxID=195482 RepID=A0A9D5DFG1_9CRYT|nr:HREF motif-containing protein [Cryptosporidium canis]
MTGSSVRRHAIELRKVHRSDQRGHLTLKYRRDSSERSKRNQSVIRLEGGATSSSDSKPAAEAEGEIQSNGVGEPEKSHVEEPGAEAQGGGAASEELGLELVCDGEEELDDDEELYRELERIRRERAEKERERRNSEIRLMMQSNPLLLEEEGPRGGAESDGDEYVLKRRWTEDTVFRNQNTASQPKKRFINDILHSDQHREFMRKYIL